MAVVVEQTIPFQTSVLDLENSSRWNTLLPLIRPSVKPISINNHTILVDQSLASSSDVLIAVIGKHGNFSSKLLESRHICAAASESGNKESISSKDITDALVHGGLAVESGVVVVRSGKRHKVEVDGDILTVEVNGDLETDHVLHLLGCATEVSRSSIENTAELVKLFLKTANTAHSSFHTTKSEANPVIVHAEGSSNGYEKAVHAIERDLKHVLRSQTHTAQEEPVTYSVHYSDVNGLSRLENYILGLEVGNFLESQNLAYVLSTSTVLQHDKLARGFAISIAQIPQKFLTPQPKATNPLVDEQAQSGSLTRVDSRYMRFSDATVRAVIERGCKAVIDEEPTITRYDEIVGDGDCGYTLRDGAKQVLKFIENKDLGDLPQTLGELVHDLEVNMGGTSGALYCIFLTALSASLATSGSIGEAVYDALTELLKYTRAREGDRTMMDCLIPFAEVFAKSGDAKAALSEASKGVERTKTLEAKLGRSTYLDERATKGVPDPGAYGLFLILRSMTNTMY